jgi:hypothetical protein
MTEKYREIFSAQQLLDANCRSVLNISALRARQLKEIR